MKKIFTFLVLVLALSCENLTDCPKLIKGKPEKHLVTDQELNTITTLFRSNNLSYENYQFFRLQIDDIGYHHVRCFQFVNDLKVLSDELIFHFDAHGDYKSLSGDIISGIDVDSSPSMGLSEVENVFLERTRKDHSASVGERFMNECLTCELVYYDLNAGKGLSTPLFVLAWKINSVKSDYPYAIINDSARSVISYDNGIRY